MTKSNSILRTIIALPQDHGSWVFILTPLTIGLFAGESFTVASIALIIAAMAAFLIRQPVSMAVKAFSGRRSRADLPAAGFWIIVYGVILSASIALLVYSGHTVLLYLGLPAAPVFAWHLWLVSRREERRQAGIEILATGVLALAAPAAFWVGTGGYHPTGWLLWILTWFQSAASIVYAYLRLEQRQWKSFPPLSTRFRKASRALAYTIFNLVLAIGLGSSGIIPPLVWLPFLVQAGESFWGTLKPAIGVKPVAVGIRQLIVTIIFTILFILAWR